MRGIYDVKIKYVTLVSAAFISFLVFFAEVLWRGWDGLDWLEYPHYALVLPPLLFILWLNYSYEFRLSAVKNLAFVAVYGTFFFAAYNSYPIAYNFLGYYGWVMLAGYMKYPWLQYLAWQLAVPFSLFCANSIIAFVFKLRLRRWEYLVLPFFPVPIYALSYVLLMLLAKTDIVPNSDWESNSIYQFKTGTIIFGYMVVEGVFVLLHQRRAAHNEDFKIKRFICIQN